VTTELLAFLHGSSLLSIKTIADSTQMATPGQANAVTVEDIDQSLLQIAAFDKRSSPAVQSLASSWKYPDGIELLGNIYRKLQAREADTTSPQKLCPDTVSRKLGTWASAFVSSELRSTEH